MLPLNPHDTVEIIAPASRCNDQRLTEIKALLASWQLNCIVSDTLFGPDLLCANTDEARFTNLLDALHRPETKAIICARGGYGSMRLIPRLAGVTAPPAPKLLIGMSDITALHLFIQQHWQWPTVHASLSPDLLSKASLAATRSLLFNQSASLAWKYTPYNRPAETMGRIQTSVTGGNLSLLQASVGTIWEMKPKGKLILIEEVGERAYRIDRMLSHLDQAGLFKEATGILFGDFLEGLEPNGTSLIDPVLRRFAQNCACPVLKIAGIGHGPINFPMPLGTPAVVDVLQSTLIVQRPFLSAG